MNRLARTRLSGEMILDHVRREDLVAQNCIVDGDAAVDRAEVHGMSFVDCKGQGNFSIRNCPVIDGSVELKNCAIAGNLNINGCHLKGDLYIFNTSIENSVHITSSDIEGRIYLDSSSCKEVVILNSTCRDISFVGSEAPARIERIQVSRTKSDGSLIVRGASLSIFDMAECEFRDAAVESCSAIAEAFALKLDNCRIGDFSYRNVSPCDGASNVAFGLCAFGTVTFFNSDLQNAKIRIAESSVSSALKFRKCKYDACTIDFSGSDVMSVGLDSSVTEFIREPGSYSPIYNKQIETASKVDMLKKVKDGLAENHQYSDEDGEYFPIRTCA